MAEFTPPRTLGAAVKRGLGAVRTELETTRPPWEGGGLVEGVRMSTTGVTEVPHRLRRKPRGFIPLGALLVGAVPADSVTVLAVSYGQQTVKMRLVSASASEIVVEYSFWFW